MSRGSDPEASAAIVAREANRAGHRAQIARRSWVEREEWRRAAADAPVPIRAPIRQRRRGRTPSQEMG